MAKSQSGQFKASYSITIKFVDYLIIKLTGSYYRMWTIQENRKELNKIYIYSHHQKMLLFLCITLKMLHYIYSREENSCKPDFKFGVHDYNRFI